MIIPGVLLHFIVALQVTLLVGGTNTAKMPQNARPFIFILLLKVIKKSL